MWVPTETGHWVNEQFAQLAEIIKDYDPYLELRWIPPEKRADPEDSRNPYCIVDTRSNYIVRHCSDSDSPVSILTSLFSADNRNGSALNRMEAENAAIEAFRLKEKMEEYEQLQDEAAFLMDTKKNYIKHNGVKLDDQLRRIE